MTFTCSCRRESGTWELHVSWTVVFLRFCLGMVLKLRLWFASASPGHWLRLAQHCFVLCCAWLISCVQLFDPMDCSPPGSSVHEDSPGKNIGVGLPKLGIEPRSPALQVDYLLSEPPGKPNRLYWVGQKIRLGRRKNLNELFGQPNRSSRFCRP